MDIMKTARILLIGMLVLASANCLAGPAYAQEGEQTGLIAIGAGLAVTAAAGGAGAGVGIAGAAAIGAIAERPEMMGRALLFVALAEACAIYGLLISFMLFARM